VGYQRIRGELLKLGVRVSATTIRTVMLRHGLQPAPRRRFVIHDRDAKFSGPFDTVFEGEGIRVIRTPIRAPKANAFAERFVRTAKTECLDHMLIYGRRHLERVLGAYVAHYLQERPHRGLGLATPSGRSASARPGPDSVLQRRDILGGLVHEYDWAA
jgi:putative transposase